MSQKEEEVRSQEKSTSGEGVVGFAILGCLIAGVVALFKALGAISGVDTLLCTIAAVLAFGSVIWFYFSKRY